MSTLIFHGKWREKALLVLQNSSLDPFLSQICNDVETLYQIDLSNRFVFLLSNAE